MADQIRQKTVKELEQEANYAAAENRGKKLAAGKLPDKLAEDDIHVMPGRFLPNGASSPKKSSSGQKKPRKNKGIWTVVIVGIVFMAALGFGLWYIVQSSAPTSQNQNINSNQNSNANNNANTNIPLENNNQSANSNQNSNTNIPNDNQNVNLNTNTNENMIPGSAVDTDQDGLTAEEELLFKTNIDRADTDLDGFNDGVEIANMFDPLVPNAGLIESGNIVEYIDAAAQYRFYRPRGWLAQNLEENELAVIPDSEAGEIISFVVLPNDQNASLDELRAIFGTAQNYENYSLDGNAALISGDGREVITVLGSNIFVINYYLGATAVPTFDSTFKMILKSFDYFG